MGDDYNLFKDDTETPIVSIFSDPYSTKKAGKKLKRELRERLVKVA